MAFMTPQYEENEWVYFEGEFGETLVVPAEYKDDGHIVVGEIVATRKGIGARLSASGYLDCTDWTIHDTEKEAREFIRETYDVDDETGDPLEEE